jgi:hypothetical protein
VLVIVTPYFQIQGEFMKNIFKVLAIIALVAVIGFSFATCDNVLDDDESYITMQASLNTIFNYSSYNLKVNVEDKNSKKISFTINAGSTQPNYSNLAQPISVKYSPASKVKASVEKTAVYFRDK